MRFVFLVPDFDTDMFREFFNNVLYNSRVKFLQDWARLKMMHAPEVHGGTLNIMRHCWVARSCGVNAVLATMRGLDTYGDRGIYKLPFISWADRRADDVCIVPDYVTELINEVEGPAIAYLQVPIHTYANFNYKDSRVRLWTDSPLMQDVCKKAYPEKEAQIVPNIVDNNLFPFIPQDQREQGLLFAFPRKGPEFIAETQKRYREKGGTYWRFELIDGLSILELAQQFRRPQVFLASAPVEGCALPPQESMAAGIVVVGRTAQGANFCMQHGETAMTAETPQKAAECLVELEDAALRDKISRKANEYISYYFPSEEPKRFWQQTLEEYSSRVSA
jgi:glycosyltransferase involved in cell wall biosynthesis